MKNKNMETHDPHNRLGVVLKVLIANRDHGVGMNELAVKAGIPKPTLVNVLETDEALKLIKCTLPKAKGQKMSIRLRQNIDTENQVLTQIDEVFEAYLDFFPKQSRVSQVESIVHLLHLISIMQMQVMLAHLKHDVSFELVQQKVKNRLDDLTEMIGKTFDSSKMSEKQDKKYARRVEQEVALVTQYLSEKAGLNFQLLPLRKKHRTMEEILYDFEGILPHEQFIGKVIDQVDNDIQKGIISKKFIDSAPMKIKKTPTKISKEFNKLQNKFAQSEGQLAFKEWFGPLFQKEIPKLTDEVFEQRHRDIKQKLESEKQIPPDQIKLVLKWMRSLRK
jgi:hypothetical protein